MIQLFLSRRAVGALVFVAAGVVALSACGSRSGSADPALPVERPTDLLSAELREYDDLLGALPSPCSSDRVLGDCLGSPRGCTVCPAAARFLAASIRSGFLPEEVEYRYLARFAPELVQVFDVRSAPALGPSEAEVTIVEFADYECPFCTAAFPVVESLVEQYSPHVRVVYMHYPLEYHANARSAAQASVAAQLQGKFWEMHRLMLAHQEQLERSDIERYAKSLDLDMRKFRDDWNSASTRGTVQANIALGKKIGLTGTPYLLINGRPYDTNLFEFGGDDLHSWIKLEIDFAASKSSKR